MSRLTNPVLMHVLVPVLFQDGGFPFTPAFLVNSGQTFSELLMRSRAATMVPAPGANGNGFAF